MDPIRVQRPQRHTNPLPPQLWNAPEIDFFDVSDDFEQKKKFFILVQKKLLVFAWSYRGLGSV